MPAEAEEPVATRRWWARGLALALLHAVAGSALAQPGALASEPRAAVSASFDLSNLYSFRGVRQNATRIALWPAACVTLPVHSGDSWLEGIALVGRTFNSLHTGDTGSGGPAGQLWYETRAAGGLQLDLAGGTAIETLFTTYVSPSELFDIAKEVSIRVSLGHDRGGALERVRPYALAVVEIDTAIAKGQLDGGLRGGTYLELGVEPDLLRTARLTVTAPVRLGLSLRDYYELAARDHRFGFVDIGGMATVPIVRSTFLGSSWAMQGGVRVERLGTTPRAFNAGDHSLVVWHLGVVLGAGG
jgi:hypothetical protein